MNSNTNVTLKHSTPALCLNSIQVGYCDYKIPNVFLLVCCTRDRYWNPLTIEIQNPSYRAFGNIWIYQPISQTNTRTYLGSSWRGLILFTNSWTLFPSCCLPILDLPSKWKTHLNCPKKNHQMRHNSSTRQKVTQKAWLKAPILLSLKSLVFA